jgi:uncharacterized protein (TIGR02145 family)
LKEKFGYPLWICEPVKYNSQFLQKLHGFGIFEGNSFRMRSFLFFVFLLIFGYSYTQTGTITDARDGKVYKTVVIGTQTWMAENLNVSTFRNGDPITEAKNIDEWIKADKNKQPAWCYYDNDPKNGLKYGKLYNWHAVKDYRGLADKGWHVPSEEEWKQLTDYLGSESVASKMKYTNFWDHYECESGNSTNESGFSALPGGLGGVSGLERYDFDFVGSAGFWWSSSEYDPDYAWTLSLNCVNVGVVKDINQKYYMFSVRCLRD